MKVNCRVRQTDWFPFFRKEQESVGKEVRREVQSDRDETLFRILASINSFKAYLGFKSTLIIDIHMGTSEERSPGYMHLTKFKTQ